MSNRVIGIDLGTTNSCVGVWLDDRVQIIANEFGSRTTPSVVSFTDDDIVVGNPGLPNTVHSVKRFIGKTYNDKTVKQDTKIVGYAIDKDDSNNIRINNYTPTEISSFILKRMKNIICDYLGEDIKDAVITVPAYFNDAQRQETKIAGEMVGLNVMKIINEPTAAALAYGLHKNRNQTVLVFDIGGGTLDVTLLQLHDDIYKVKATSGDTHLGGDDFDNRLVIYCLEQFCGKYKSLNKLDVIQNKKVLNKLKKACQNAKVSLSLNQSANVCVESLYEGIDFMLPITRVRFESLCADLFRKCLEPVDRVLYDSLTDRKDVDEIVLVGGSSRIPKIQSMLSEYFGGKKLNCEIDPDEAVAYGATVQAAMIKGENKVNDIVLCDVISLSLGLKTEGGVMTNIINRNTLLPVTKEQEFTTMSDNQPSIDIEVYEGERGFVKDNHLLGVFTLTGLPMLPRGEPKIKIKFNVDVNGILSVSATEESSKVSKKIIINKSSRSFDTKGVAQHLENAEKYKNVDKKDKEAKECAIKFNTYLHNLRKTVNSVEFRDKMSDNEYLDIVTMINKEHDMIDDSIDKTYIDSRMNELDSIIRRYIVR